MYREFYNPFGVITFFVDIATAFFIRMTKGWPQGRRPNVSEPNLVHSRPLENSERYFTRCL